MPFLEVRNIFVNYGDLQVLRGVNLRVEKGELVTVLGSNGGGKSTLCKAIIGVVKLRAGEIFFNSTRIDKLSPHSIIRLGVSIVPEGRRIFGHMTVLENLELGMYVFKNKKQVEDSLEWVFNLFPILRERKKQLASSLSGGEQQMLAVARALMPKPSFLILDEPSLGLSPKMVLHLYKIIEEIRQDNITILLVEQYADQALKISDRGYVMENGSITLEGSAEGLLNDEKVKKIYLGETH